MLPNQNLGEWIRSKYGDQGGLAVKLKPMVAKNTVSSWKTGRNGIPPEYQKQIRTLGYTGPWPHDKAQESPAPAGGPYATASDFVALKASLEKETELLRKDVARLRRRLGEAFALIQDLGRRAGIELPPQEPVE